LELIKGKEILFVMTWFEACGLELHPATTKTVYRKDDFRKGKHQYISFDFLGSRFRPRLCPNRVRQSIFVSFTPAESKSAQKGMIKKIRMLSIRKRTYLSLEEIAKWINPIINGWINYYVHFYRSKLYKVFHQINNALICCAKHKDEKLHRRQTIAGKFMENIANTHGYLFAPWKVVTKEPMV
jgi:RNA-directed DNA polymerase